MASDRPIYRTVDIRALAHFHDGPGGLSVEAERIWCRLLIDTMTTPVPGLVLARRGDLMDRCRIANQRRFDAAWKELADAGMVGADWPLGVVILPSAPRQRCHEPVNNNTVIAWAKFLDQQAPRCEAVERLRDDWRAALLERGPEWLAAFDTQARGAYKKPPKPKTEVSPERSGEFSGETSPERSEVLSGTLSQESGVRSQEDPPLSPASGGAEPTTFKLDPTKGKATREDRRKAAVAVHESNARGVLAALSDARLRCVKDARALRATDDNLKGIIARLEAGATVDDCLHVIAVREAEVTANPESAQWFNAVTPFTSDQFTRAIGQTVGTVTRPAAAPRPQAHRLLPTLTRPAS